MLVELDCTYCGKKFDRQKKDINKTNNFCSRRCVANYQQELFSDEYSLVRYMLKNCKKRARRDNILFDLQLEDLKTLWERQEGLCALSGEALVFGNTWKEKDSGYSTASLDRRDSSRGYVPENVQIIHKDINQMKFDFDQQVFINWCHKVARTHPYVPLDTLSRKGYDGTVSDDQTPF